MGSDGDILVPHGPTSVFSHSPATYYNSYKNCRFQNTNNNNNNNNSNSANNNSSSSSSTSTTQRQRLKSPNRANSSRSSSSSERKPNRPCLVNRPDDSSSSSSSSSDENEPQSPNANRQKKKVVFADDRGLSLTQVSGLVYADLHMYVFFIYCDVFSMRLITEKSSRK